MTEDDEPTCFFMYESEEANAVTDAVVFAINALGDEFLVADVVSGILQFLAGAAEVHEETREAIAHSLEHAAEFIMGEHDDSESEDGPPRSSQLLH